MTLPLHSGAKRRPTARPPDGHAGLWFDKFCDQWVVQNHSWTMGTGKGDEGSSRKLEWIKTVTSSKIGTKDQIDELGLRLARLVDKRGGRYAVFTSESRFVTGLGRSHPIENGFAWHPTLGTPYLPGSSVKGAVRAWVESDADSSVPCEAATGLLGGPGSAGGICFLDAVPVEPVQLEADVMTPHYAAWTEDDLPGDWRSPTPIPFLVTRAGTPFLFGIIPCGSVANGDLDAVSSWLCSALVWSGSGAKTAVGYGRFARDDAKTDELRQRLRDEEREHETRIRAEREVSEQAARRAAMHPIDREIEEILDARPNQSEPDVTTIIRMVGEGRWSGSGRIHVARWLERNMKAAKQWREVSNARNPDRDKMHQRTLRVKSWLKAE